MTATFTAEELESDPAIHDAFVSVLSELACDAQATVATASTLSSSKALKESALTEHSLRVTGVIENFAVERQHTAFVPAVLETALNSRMSGEGDGTSTDHRVRSLLVTVAERGSGQMESEEVEGMQDDAGTEEDQGDDNTAVIAAVAGGGTLMASLAVVAIRRRQRLRVKPEAIKTINTTTAAGVRDGTLKNLFRMPSLTRHSNRVLAVPLDRDIDRDSGETASDLTNALLHQMEQGNVKQGIDAFGTSADDLDLLMGVNDSDSDDGLGFIDVPIAQAPELPTSGSSTSIDTSASMEPTFLPRVAPEMASNVGCDVDKNMAFSSASLASNGLRAPPPTVPKLKTFALALAPSVERAVESKTRQVFALISPENDVITDIQLSRHLGISRREAAHIITEAKLALHGRNSSVNVGEHTLTCEEFSNLLKLATEPRDGFVSMEDVPPRKQKQYRRIFDDLDHNGTGLLSLQQLAHDLPGLDVNSLGAKHTLSFQDFVSILHRSERGAAGRTIAQLLEDTSEGSLLLEAVRKSRAEAAAKEDHSTKTPDLHSNTVPAVARDIWTAAAPDDNNRVVVERLRDELVGANARGDLLCSADDLMHMVCALESGGLGGLIDFHVFWRTLEPLVEVVDNDHMISHSVATSVATSVMTSRSDSFACSIVPACRSVFSDQLKTHVGHNGEEVLSADQVREAIEKTLLIDQMEGNSRTFFFHLMDKVSSHQASFVDFTAFVALCKEAERLTMNDTDCTAAFWDAADALGAL